MSLRSGAAVSAVPVVVGVFVLLLALEAAGKPRPPVPPYPETGIIFSEHWDQPYRFAADQVVAPNVWAESWSGYCLDRTAGAVVPWAIPVAVTNGALMDTISGAIRFWYQPACGGGTGPGHVARLLTLVSAGGGSSAAWFSLVVTPDGSALSLICGEDPQPCLGAPLAIQGWNLITLCYSPTNSAIFINDTLAAAGGGLPSLPAQLVPYTSLVVGSGLDGMETASGQIDELTVFSGRGRLRRQAASPFGLTALDIAGYWQCYAATAALGAISAEEEAEQAAAREARRAARSLLSATAMNSPMDGPQPDDPQPPCGTNDIHDVWMTNATAGYFTNQGWTVSFTIAGGTNGVLYDVFGTGALSNIVGDSYWVWLTNGHACDHITVTNQWSGAGFYLLGLPTDTDSGGLSDAYENLITHGNTQDPSDDLTNALVGIYAVDSVASEQPPTNTATFLVTRRGGRMNLPLTIGCLVSGTATLGTDYGLAPMTSTPTNVLVTIPAGLTNVSITVTPRTDTNTEGSETVTLTLTTNVAPCDVNPAHASATAWILEQYSYTYTTVAHFNQGVLDGLEAVSTNGDGHLQFKTNLPPQFPYLAVACSGRGTVARINTSSGQVIGEYRTAPDGLVFTGDSGSGPQPSRTTVDLFGNVWVANRADDFAMDRTTNGAITRIGLVLGARFSKTNNTYYPDPKGHYISLSNATYNTCFDRDGDGYICTSAGLADILPWTNQRDGLSDADSRGGVSTAEDEAITEYVRVACTGTRTIAVDKFNDIWVGGRKGRQEHLQVNGLTGAPVPNSVFAPHAGGCGGVIDTLGALWSSNPDGRHVLRLTPPTAMPPSANDWQVLQTGDAVTDEGFYGVAVDPVHPYIWQTVNGQSYAFRWFTSGTPVTNANGTLRTYPHGGATAQGLTVDARGHVWVAHGNQANTVGHLDTNGVHLGDVNLRLAKLRGQYFANTNLDGFPVLERADAPIDFDWGSGAPDPVVPTNDFSVRWSGVVTSSVEGYVEFYVSADAGAGFRLTVSGGTVIDNWDNPDPNPVELSGTAYLSSGENSLVLEYKELTGDARIRLSWTTPGTTNKVVIPREALKGPNLGTAHPTGVSVDSEGNIWAANLDNNTAMRINPNAGAAVVTNGVTNFVGEVDMVVGLGDNTTHPAPYNVAASPYNYSDMTGFNNRIVNPALEPFKGYWSVINDCGMADEIWQRVGWTDNLPLAGCAIEVFVRAGNDRQALVNQSFVPAAKDVSLVGIQGRYIEVRVGITRDDPSKQPLLYDVTVFGSSSGLEGDLFLDDSWAYESEDAYFSVNLAGPGPVSYEWYTMPPWTNEWSLVAGASGPELVMTNVDQWDDATWVSVIVSNAAGQMLEFGPATLSVFPLSIGIPASGSSGPAERYPATINVRGEPTNGLSRVEVALHNLRHAYPSDLDILLVSPSGTKIMLISDAGSSFAVTNATLVFHPNWQGYASPPESGAISSNQESHYRASNLGDQETQLPGAPAGPYLVDLGELQFTDANPNGIWKLYIYDDKAGQTGVLETSWSLSFYYAQ